MKNTAGKHTARSSGGIRDASAKEYRKAGGAAVSVGTERAAAKAGPRRGIDRSFKPGRLVGEILLLWSVCALGVLACLNYKHIYPFGDKSWLAAALIGAMAIAGCALTFNGFYKRMAFQKKMGLWGMLFLLPWALGFLLFFLSPMLRQLIYSFEDVNLQAGSMSEEFVFLENYHYLLFEDASFLRTLVETMLEVFLYTALILVFSLLCAILLNGKFFGRSFARAVFFIPIVMATGLMLDRVSNTEGLLMAQSQEEQVYGAAIVSRLLFSLGVGTDVVTYLVNAVNDIFEVVSLSGIQILIFLAALQGIPPQLYEVAKIEGATPYQTFWKVTVVMVSPMLLTCTLYTISDLFLRSDLANSFQDYAFTTGKFGRGSAMSALFLVGVVIVIVVYVLPLRKGVFYYD